MFLYCCMGFVKSLGVPGTDSVPVWHWRRYPKDDIEDESEAATG